MWAAGRARSHREDGQIFTHVCGGWKSCYFEFPSRGPNRVQKNTEPMRCVLHKFYLCSSLRTRRGCDVTITLEQQRKGIFHKVFALLYDASSNCIPAPSSPQKHHKSSVASLKRTLMRAVCFTLTSHRQEKRCLMRCL